MTEYDWKAIFENVRQCKESDMSLYNESLLSVTKAKSDFMIFALRKYIGDNSLNDAQIDLLESLLIECREFYGTHNIYHKSHFGFPSNMVERSVIYDIFAEYERYAFLTNNCGDTYENGNYHMDSKEIERRILQMFAEKFGLPTGSFWGYMTSGGSESNAWGIENAFRENPDGILYYCESAHYSVSKIAKNYPRIIVPQASLRDESIATEYLFNKIKQNSHAPVNILLTWGTTKYGSCDEVQRITEFLTNNNIRYYAHIDAALFGGIPNNQRNAPILCDIKALNINSVSVSLHKYIGVPIVKSVLLTVKKPRIANRVDYIGQDDSTTSGSRDLMPFSMLQQTMEILTMSHPDDYQRNIVFFEKELADNKLSYFRAKLSNIFVIDKPNMDICTKYQLSDFTDGEGKEKAHIIIFPYHTIESMKLLIDDLIAMAISS